MAMVRNLRRPLAERLWEKALADGSGCWIWQGSGRKGYGRISAGRRGDGMLSAHRVAYEIVKGPIPEGLEPDHLCRNRACINPAHLEVMTHRENVLRGEGPTAGYARQTHCKRGHEFTAENTSHENGSRICRPCRRARESRRDKRRKVQS